MDLYSAATVANTFMFLGAAVVFTAAFVVIYMYVTPYDELVMIKNDNLAAAYSLGGAIVGFVLPLSAVIRHSHSLVEMSIWAVISLVIQLVIYALIRLTLGNMEKQMKDGDTAPGAFLGAVHVAAGIITSACLTP